MRILEAPQFAQLNWLVHGFSTRTGGASELESNHDGRKEPEKVLNLGFAEWDTREHVLENRPEFLRGLERGVTCAKSACVKFIRTSFTSQIPRTPNRLCETAKADALITNEPGLLLVVQIADCVPILSR